MSICLYIYMIYMSMLSIRRYIYMSTYALDKGGLLSSRQPEEKSFVSLSFN